MTNDQKKITDPKQALAKAAKYCAYQERSHQEVRDKLYEWGLWKKDVEEIILQLITDGYLNEERFAVAFAGGKFRIKKWGRIKIRIELKKKRVSDYCIRKALEEIDDKEYLRTMKEITVKKLKEIRNMKYEIRNYKVARYVISRGYEPELVWDLLREKE